MFACRSGSESLEMLICRMGALELAADRAPRGLP
jgi:hypothetical protein